MKRTSSDRSCNSKGANLVEVAYTSAESTPSPVSSVWWPCRHIIAKTDTKDLWQELIAGQSCLAHSFRLFDCNNPLTWKSWKYPKMYSSVSVKVEAGNSFQKLFGLGSSLFFKVKKCTKNTAKGPWLFMIFVAKWLLFGTNTVITLELLALSPYFRTLPKLGTCF